MSNTFTINDYAGQPHEYTVALHPARRGLAITSQLMSIGAEPLATLADAALTGDKLSKLIAAALGDDTPGAKKKPIDEQLDALIADVDLVALLGDLELPKVAVAFRSAISDVDLADLAPAILSECQRDGTTLEALAIDRVYAGNYVEMLTACWRVIGINRFLLLAGT